MVVLGMVYVCMPRWWERPVQLNAVSLAKKSTSIGAAVILLSRPHHPAQCSWKVGRKLSEWQFRDSLSEECGGSLYQKLQTDPALSWGFVNRSHSIHNCHNDSFDGVAVSFSFEFNFRYLYFVVTVYDTGFSCRCGNVWNWKTFFRQKSIKVV